MYGNLLNISSSRHIDTPLSVCFEKDLSAKALGCYVKMRALSDSFHFTVEGFAKLFKEGRESIRKGIMELEEHGYVIRAQRRWGSGEYANDTLWVTLDEPGLSEEVLDFLKAHNFTILTKSIVRTSNPELHYNLDAAEARLSAEEERRRAELRDPAHFRYPASSRETLKAAKQADFELLGDDVFHNIENPRSEPMPENWASVMTCDMLKESGEVVECDLGIKSDASEGMWKTSQNPRSEPMPKNWASVMTCEDIENPSHNPRSEPMPKNWASVNQELYNSLSGTSFSTSNSTQPKKSNRDSGLVDGAPAQATAIPDSPTPEKPTTSESEEESRDGMPGSQGEPVADPVSKRSETWAPKAVKTTRKPNKPSNNIVSSKHASSAETPVHTANEGP